VSKSIHRLPLSLSLVLLVPLTYCLAQETDAPRAAIRGTVLNSITHEPVPRALVTLMGNVAALTDDQGRFESPSSPAYK
jgi:hypothetical protein